MDQEVGVKVDLLLHLVIAEEQEILQLLRLLKELQVEKVMMVYLFLLMVVAEGVQVLQAVMLLVVLEELVEVEVSYFKQVLLDVMEHLVQHLVQDILQVVVEVQLIIFLVEVVLDREVLVVVVLVHPHLALLESTEVQTLVVVVEVEELTPLFRLVVLVVAEL